jgi:hypothetical protein
MSDLREKNESQKNVRVISERRYMYDDDKRVKTRMAFYVHLLEQQRPSILIMVQL